MPETVLERGVLTRPVDLLFHALAAVDDDDEAFNSSSPLSLSAPWLSRHT